MTYHTEDFRGFAQDCIVLKKEQDDTTLFYKIKDFMENEIKQRGIPAVIHEGVVKSGGMFGQKKPLLVIAHSDSACKYFFIGIFVAGIQVYFPLLGESAENTKCNRKKRYQESGNFIMAGMTKPDEFKLQQEAEWQYQVLDCFNSGLE